MSPATEKRIQTMTMTYSYDETTMVQEVPDHTSRDRLTDLKAVAVLFVKGPPTEHMVENKDLLEVNEARHMAVAAVKILGIK